MKYIGLTLSMLLGTSYRIDRQFRGRYLVQGAAWKFCGQAIATGPQGKSASGTDTAITALRHCSRSRRRTVGGRIRQQ